MLLIRKHLSRKFAFLGSPVAVTVLSDPGCIAPYNRPKVMGFIFCCDILCIMLHNSHGFKCTLKIRIKHEEYSTKI